MEFDENKGSQVEQSGLCDVGDEILSRAIRRMGIGQILPIEEPLVAEGEGQCSTQVEPSPPQAPHASDEQREDSQQDEQAQGQDQLPNSGDVSHDIQALTQGSEPAHDQDQVQPQDLDQVEAQDQEQEQPQVQGQTSEPAQVESQDDQDTVSQFPSAAPTAGAK